MCRSANGSGTGRPARSCGGGPRASILFGIFSVDLTLKEAFTSTILPPLKLFLFDQYESISLK